MVRADQIGARGGGGDASYGRDVWCGRSFASGCTATTEGNSIEGQRSAT